MKKITLLTTQKGLWKFKNNEAFPGKLEMDYYNVFPFQISPAHIVDRNSNISIVGTGSDSEF